MIARIVTLVGIAALCTSTLPHPDPVAPEPASPAPAATAAAAGHPAPDGRIAQVEARLASRARRLGAAERRQLARILVASADHYALSVELVLAVIQVESAFNPFAVSPVGAMGLMQLLPTTAVELAEREGVAWRGPQSLFDPGVNVQLGSAYLRELLDRYGSVRVALAAYNWGPGRIDRRLRRGHPLPVIYPSRVLAAYEGESPIDS